MCCRNSEWPHKRKLTKIRPVRRQNTKLGAISNRKTVPVKECNVLEGLPKKTFLLCAEHMAITSDALSKSKVMSGYSRDSDNTDRKQTSRSNDTDRSSVYLELDDDVNSQRGAPKNTTSLVPILDTMLPKMITGKPLEPVQLGVYGSELFLSDEGDASVKKKKKRREPKQPCCLQQHYMDLSLPKLKQNWSGAQPLEAKLSMRRRRKRHILRVACLPTTAYMATSAFDDADVSLPYLKHGRSNTEYRLSKSCNTDTNDLKRSVVLAKLRTSENLTVKENMGHISKCELFTSYNM